MTTALTVLWWLLVAAGLAVTVRALLIAAADNNRRGRARAHGDDDTPSWAPRIPAQRGRL